MKYLKTKHTRRRGAALELAMMLFVVMTAVTIMVVNTSMIQVNKQKQSYFDLTDVVDDINQMQKDQIGKFFISCILNEYESSPSGDFFIPNEENIEDYITNAFGNESLDGTEENYTFDVTGPEADKISIEGNKTSIAYTLDILKQGGPIYTITVLFNVKKSDNQYTVTYSIVRIA